MIDNIGELVKFLISDQEKLYVEALDEIECVSDSWLSDEAKQAYGDIIPSDRSDRKLFVLKQPIGVCAATIS